MNGRSVGRAVVALLALTWAVSPSAAEPIPSKAIDAPVVVAPESDQATIESLLARDEVARALAAHGLTPEEAERRLAELSPEDLTALAADLDQIQAAGDVPNYIWILLAVLMGVTILATVF